MSDPSGGTSSLYDAVGGMPFFERLVDAFYTGVASDDILLPLYPEAPDLSGARHRLALFLAQYWGGPTTYNDERGHPRLRMRHMPFHVGPLQRDRWLHHMSAAVEQCAPTAEIAEVLMRYFAPAAEQMRNDTGLPISSPGQPRPV
ncbi:MAG TPA: globin [Ilumatobacteraceae bacterium]